MYDIPDQIFAQYNHAQVSTMMGLFAELNFAWISIDNALYLWDYTQTNPELLGFEDQPNSITAIKLVVPRAGVFNKNITHLLVVATTHEILTIGVEAKTGPTGVRTVTLFQTGMSLSIRGIDVRVIEGSAATGRIFFGGGGDNEVYELQYQQEEKWFSNKYKKVNHTGAGYSSFVPTMIWGKASPESVRDIAIDDSRNILYTLSSESSIRVFHMDTPTSLRLMLEKKQSECLRDMSHMISQSPLLDQRMRIVSISPISATEAAKLHLMATTSTGCRLFLSATSGYGYLAGKLNPPTNMQVQHIKFPPPDPLDAQPRSPGQVTGFSSMELPILTTSKSLEQTRRGIRFSPGYFLCFASRPPNLAADSLFLSSPDSGRIALQARESAGQGSKYYEQGSWVKLDSRAEDIGLVTKPFAASKTPRGFGNELAVQFDEPSTEIAILTNTGIHTLRRRRLVDIFATAIRQGGGDEGLDTEVTKFIRHYGRAETAAAALAVACGQGFDSSPGDGRIAKVMDPSTLEFARKTFIDHGGRPSFSQEPISESPDLELRLSARHEGLSLYMTRLIRSLWKAPVVREILPENGKGAATLLSTVSASKLRSVQEDMIKLHTFLDRNHTFIEGLAGPDLQRAATKNDELAVQGEHRALNALWLLITSITEGISFALMLFEERMDQIFASLDDTTRQQVRDLTYESLFVSNEGKTLGKVLVKAIVNRNIANGSNVETVADALRRKCKSFCSADDVLIFKAQEQLKKASEHGSSSDLGRNMLNESLRLFQRVAESLGYENLETTVRQYIALQFFAGAIQLCLKVASETDRGNRALAWVNDDKPANDSREAFYLKRKRCYDLIHTTLDNLDAASSNEPERVDGKLTVFARKRNEAYTIINESPDEVFHYYLYDYYLDNSEAEKLLSIDSPFVITYLQRLANKSVEHADLLWKLYASTQRYYDAATVQLNVAKSDFKLPLKLRIECLSRAKANASCNQIGIGRQAQQVLLHEISELLEVANIQDEILQRLKVDPRIDRARKAQIVQNLDGAVLNLTTVSLNV
jgi:nuclear pore complex protein Nup155